MHLLKACTLLVFTTLLIFSCNKDDDESVETYQIAFDAISETEYNASDIFEGDQVEIYDTWKALSIDQGGIVGTTSLPADFDFLLVKPNGVFGIVRNDSLITTGEIVNIENTDNVFRIKFESEVESERLDVQILGINQITVQIDEDGTMRLMYSTSATVLTNKY